MSRSVLTDTADPESLRARPLWAPPELFAFAPGVTETLGFDGGGVADAVLELDDVEQAKDWKKKFYLDMK